jgi:endonuclease YncB( thermonuclease family)
MVWAGLIVGLLWFNLPHVNLDADGDPSGPGPEINLSSIRVVDGDTFWVGGDKIRIAIRIVDGDTFWVGGDKIRIADIDTPETHPPRCAHEAELGERATRRLAALLAEGPFDLQPIGGRDTDQYGRKLRIVTRGGRSLGDQLVAEGLARTWTGRREPWCV